MNNTIRKLLAERQSALKAEDTKLRKKLQSSIQHEIRYAKRTLARQVDLKFQTDSKSAWTNLKSLLKLNDSHAECSVDANTLNTFCARFETDSVIVPDLPSVDSDAELFFSISDVHNVFRNVDISKSSGPDGISARMIKTLAYCLATPMCTLFNNSIKSATVLDIWKSANIIPLPKRKGATEPKDFRSIVLTPIIAKCIEKLVAPHISKHITDTNQFAYKRNSSTDDALLVLLDRVTHHLDWSAKNYVRSIFIGFSSAFNTINTAILVQKMSSHSVNPNIIA